MVKFDTTEFEIELNEMTGEQNVRVKLDDETEFHPIKTKWLVGAIRAARAANKAAMEAKEHQDG
jgi:hypothetical protein